MQSRILIVGHHYESIHNIKEQLMLNKLYQVIEAEDQVQAFRKMASHLVNLVIFDLDLFTDEKVQLARNIRNSGYAAPVMVVAKAVQSKALEIVSELPRTVVLEKPYEYKELYGITSKLLSGRNVPQRIHRRFYTNQTATLETLGNSRMKYDGSMMNLSKGGAYLELPNAKEKISGLIKMSVPLSDVNKSYEVNARVVWNSEKGLWGRGAGVGVEFIQARDIYRNLLNNL